MRATRVSMRVKGEETFGFRKLRQMSQNNADKNMTFYKNNKSGLTKGWLSAILVARHVSQ